MEQFQDHNLEYMVQNYYEIADVDDNLFEDPELPREGVYGYLDLEFEDDVELVCLT